MLRVSDLISMPQFETFKLINEADGLDNIVAGTGILEWESPKEIATDFSPNDFVMTTLYMYRDELSNADEALKALIKRRVSAIAIKSTFVDSCSDEVIKLANLYNIPIFIYRDVYLETLIFTIESALLTDNANDISLGYLKYLRESSTETAAEAALKLNPLFLSNLICMCLIASSEDDQSTLDAALNSYNKSFPLRFPVAKGTDSFIRCKQCILYIYSFEAPFDGYIGAIDNLTKRFNIDIASLRIGISDAKSSLAEINDAIDEAIWAAISSSISKDRIKEFSSLGSDIFFLPFWRNKYYAKFYTKTLDLIEDYDRRHNSDLLMTIITYVESDYDINLTAKKLFQHPNTIRHRIGKLKELMKTTSHHDSQLQFSAFAKLHIINDRFGCSSII